MISEKQNHDNSKDVIISAVDRLHLDHDERVEHHGGGQDDGEDEEKEEEETGVKAATEGRGRAADGRRCPRSPSSTQIVFHDPSSRFFGCRPLSASFDVSRR